MASATIPVSASRPAVAANDRIPWYLWSLTLALILVTVGGQADVSWHRSIGRDSFFTPPHMMVYACGLIAGVTCAWIILATTFSCHSPLRPASVAIFGLHAPLGIFVTAWGGLMMLYSAPVDNWWHNAYGLDVRVVSPPHILLLTGTWAVAIGTLLLAASHMNRTRHDSVGAPSQTASPFEVGEYGVSRSSTSHQLLFLFVGSLAFIHLMSYSMGYTFDTHLHSAKPYFVLSTGAPFVLAALAVAARPRRWTATTVAAIYTVFMLLTIWGLELIPATPHLGPDFQAITHLVPPKFPILLLVPAFALDLLWQRTPALNRWARAALSGIAWVTLLVAAEWPFAQFLMSPPAANRFFATGPGFIDFNTPSTNPDVLRLFETPQHGLPLIAGLIAAAIAAAIFITIGKQAGRYLRQVLR